MFKTITVLVAAVAFSISASAADKSAETMSPDMKTMMKKMEAAGKPGPQHKMLSDKAGSWSYVSKMWQGPNTTAMESKGTTEFKSILGGRFLQQDFKGEAMGQSFEGIGLLGYDNVKGKFESVWIDTMSTGVMRGEGTYDQQKKVLKESGKMSCPITADKEQEFRNEWQMLSNKKMVFSMYGSGPTDGPEFKMMEITYTR